MRTDGQVIQMIVQGHLVMMTYGFLRKDTKTTFRTCANHYHVSSAPSNVLKSYFLSFVSENRRIFAACKY